MAVIAAAGLFYKAVHRACQQSQQSYAVLCSLKAMHLQGTLCGYSDSTHQLPSAGMPWATSMAISKSLPRSWTCLLRLRGKGTLGRSGWHLTNVSSMPCTLHAALVGMLNPSRCPAQHACCTHLLPQAQVGTHILLPSCCTGRKGVLPAAVTSMCRKASAHAQALHNSRRAILPLRNAIHRLTGAGEGLITPIHADLAQW